MGLVSRPGMLHEFGTGSAVGWGLLLLTILAGWLFPAVLSGPQGVRAGAWLTVAAPAAAMPMVEELFA